MLNIKKITQLRKNRGWEQRELAQAANINPSVISRLERGLQGDFKLSVILGIANALDVQIDDLLDNPQTNDSSQLCPEFKSTIIRLSHQPTYIQNRIVGMINGYLSVLESEV